MAGKDGICRRESCVECCLETEMPLSKDDIERILGLGFSKDDFCASGDGWIRLKNAGGRCVFCDGEGCRIYDDRPEGCRLYPVIWDEDEEVAKLDWVCPHSESFEIGKGEKDGLEELVTRLKKERESRVDKDEEV